MKKKKEKKKLFKKSIDVIRKTSEAERKKSEEKKKEKKNKPRGMTAKKTGMIIFWTLFLFMFLVTMVNIFGVSSVPAKEENKASKLMDNEGLEFAKEFVYQYFTWSTDNYGRDRRIHDLDRYFLDGIDDLGGIIFDKKWSSSIDKRDIVLKDIQEINHKLARYIFKVKFTLKSPTDAKNTGSKKHMDFEETLKEERKMRVVDGYNVKVNEKFISVPIYYNKDTDKFAVYTLPSFTYVSESKMDDQVKNNLSKLDTLSDTYVENNIKAFLETFFESYTKDGKDKLNYILEDERHQNGLNGTMEFSKIQDSKIYLADDNNNKFIVDSEVVLKDPSTKFEFANKFTLVIKRVDQRYVIESLNDEKSVNEIVDKYLEEKGSDDADNQGSVEEAKDFNYQDELVSEENDDDSNQDYEVNDEE
ncbi:conjugal transfer protein [Lentibacillus sp. N15]|uniref:conjugal transfer protein n=1 Tax=Lentibacillus songyuanensis TaxID=3136161 RepID=UPI0031BAF01C